MSRLSGYFEELFFALFIGFFVLSIIVGIVQHTLKTKKKPLMPVLAVLCRLGYSHTHLGGAVVYRLGSCAFVSLQSRRRKAPLRTSFFWRGYPDGVRVLRLNRYGGGSTLHCGVATLGRLRFTCDTFSQYLYAQKSTISPLSTQYCANSRKRFCFV